MNSFQKFKTTKNFLKEKFLKLLTKKKKKRVNKNEMGNVGNNQ